MRPGALSGEGTRPGASREQGHPGPIEVFRRVSGDLVMLNKLKEEIAACHRQAAECREKAEQTSDPEMKRDLLALERSWLFLASSYELSERLSDFTDEADRRTKG